MLRRQTSVEVKLEIGHRAYMRDKVTEEGFTHDWVIFVRGADGNNIDGFVEKVVFHLHESFPKPKRVIKEPPYTVKESGYAGFIMPIEVYFRSKDEPKKVSFKYDLYLRLEPVPVSNIRIEKLTFQNPSEDFRSKLLKAGGIAGAALTGSAGGSASLSTQACAPPPSVNIDDHQPIHPKASVGEKKPRSHVPCKDSGHSSQTKSKSAFNSSSNSSLVKEGKSSSKESHKSKDGHHSNKESRHSSKETHHSTKDSQPSKDTPLLIKETILEKDSHHPPKDSHPSKETHHSIKESHHKVKDHHSKEGHKKDNHHSSKDGKSSKESRSSKDHSAKDSKSSKSGKSDKESQKSGTKRPNDSHNSHGNVEKKKKTSPVSSENSEKSSSHSKHKIKEGKEKEKQKVKSLANSIKKEEEKPKHKSSPIPTELLEAKEMIKPKLNSPKPQSPVVVKPPSPSPKAPSPDSHSLDSSSDESHKSFIKAHYSSPGSPASSISESSLHGNKPLDFMAVSYTNVISPLSDEEPVDEDLSPPPKRKLLSPVSDMDDSSQEPKPLENRPMPKLNKKQHTHHKSSKPKSENFHRGNGSINSDISMHHSPSPENQNNDVNNSAYREELLEMQRIIMSSNNVKLLQGVVDVIEKTGKYELTNTTFDFDLCTLDYAIIQEIKHCLSKNCDNCF